MPVLSSATSYCDYATYVEYCDLTGRVALDETTISPYLIQATLSIDRKYGGRFIGRKQSSTQPLQWPRSPVGARTIDTPDGVYFTDADGNYRDFSVTPVEIQQATVEVALATMDGSDLLSQEQPTVSEETVRLDVLSTTTKYNTAFQTKSTLVFLIETIMRPLLAPVVTRLRFTA